LSAHRLIDPGWPAPGRLDVHDKVREANTAFLNLVELSTNSKAVVSAILAMSLATGGLVFADDHGDRNDQGRNEKAQRGGQQDHRASNNNARRDERGAGPNHDFRRGQRLPTEYRGRQYVVDDWRGHHLSAPPRGYHWVQTGGDYVLVAIATGVILQLLLNH
jgi:Ni/Co efflux regulator RcnB